MCVFILCDSICIGLLNFCPVDSLWTRNEKIGSHVQSGFCAYMLYKASYCAVWGIDIISSM